MSRFAVGALLVHLDPATGNLSTLLQQRSLDEHEPLTWCVFGGMAELGETILECLIREVNEEAGIDVSGYQRILAHTFEDGPGQFKYHTYIVPLPRRITPTLSSESTQAQWVRLGRTSATLWSNLPRPLHSGMLDLIRDPQVERLLRLFRTPQAPALEIA